MWDVGKSLVIANILSFDNFEKARKKKGWILKFL